MAWDQKSQCGALMSELTCCYCAGSFEQSWVESAQGYGALTCGCGASPVIEGVPWLARRGFAVPAREDPALERATEFVRRGDAAGALREALLWSSRSRARRVATLLERLGRSAPRVLLSLARRHIDRSVIRNQALTYSGALRELRNSRYADYLYHRFANPSLLAAIPVILLLRELAARQGRPARVVEIGGGTGHATFLMQRYLPDLHTILTDSDFTNLYLARRFIAPRATCICLNAEARLPFADHSVDAVYCQDAFHYMREKADLVGELRRVVRPGGLWLFPHLHNALVSNPAAGLPLAPAGYARLFSFLDARLFAEESILHQFHADQCIDLSATVPASELASAAALTLVAGPSTLWRKHDLKDLFLRPARDLSLNRIYAGAASGAAGPIQWPNGDLQAECGAIERFLQRRPRVDRGALERLNRGEATHGDEQALSVLIRDFALVPTPERYG